VKRASALTRCAPLRSGAPRPSPHAFNFTRKQRTALASCYWQLCPDGCGATVPVLRAVGEAAAGFDRFHGGAPCKNGAGDRLLIRERSGQRRRRRGGEERGVKSDKKLEAMLAFYNADEDLTDAVTNVARAVWAVEHEVTVERRGAASVAVLPLEAWNKIRAQLDAWTTARESLLAAGRAL